MSREYWLIELKFRLLWPITFMSREYWLIGIKLIFMQNFDDFNFNL